MKTFEVTAEGIEVDVVPGVVIPSMVLLNIVSMMISVDMVSSSK